MFCREEVAQLRQETETFCAYGARIGLITVGSRETTAEFCQSRQIAEPFLCLNDSEKRAYRAYGLSAGSFTQMFSPKVWVKGIQATLHGHIVGMPKGDPWQMPGVFIVDSAGKVRYAHYNKDASDNPPNAELFAVLERLAADSGMRDEG